MNQRDELKKQAVQEQFGSHATSYVTSAGHAKGTDLDEIVSWLEPASNDLALDIATGGGHMANALSPQVRQVIALDLTRPMLDAAQSHARKLGLDNLLYVVGDAEKLPFADESFELVTCRIAPHHFPHPERFVQEVARVLKRGGRFALTDNVAPEDEKAAHFLNEVEQMRDLSHVQNVPVSIWRMWLTNAGLTVDREKQWSKELAFPDWVARTADSQEQQHAVEQHLLTADTTFKERFAIHVEHGRVISFSTDQWLAFCQKGIVKSTPPLQNFWISGLDHVQLAAPTGCESEARHFFGVILGMKEITKPEELRKRGGVWFQCGVHQIHIGVDPYFVAAKKAHPAIHVKELPMLMERLISYGISVTNDELLPGAKRFYANDPFGNRLEFLEWK